MLSRFSGIEPTSTPSASELDDLRCRLLQLANEEFPERARTGAYPVRFNHCFLRIVYDNLLGAQWQTVLQKGQAAYKQLSPKQLTDAIALGESIVADPGLCRTLNNKSLEYRGKKR